MIDQQSRKEIIICVSEKQYAVGNPINLTIRYINQSGGSISFREPAKTWEVMLSVCAESKEERQVPFGRIFYYKGEGYERTSIEDAEQINLTQGEEYKFDYDVGSRWPELFAPGKYELRVVDRSEDDQMVISNTISLRVIFTEESLDKLLQIVGDEESTLDARMFATHWIREFYPELHLNMEGLSSAEKAKNRQLIKTVRSWWETNRHTPESKAKISKINILK